MNKIIVEEPVKAQSKIAAGFLIWRRRAVISEIWK
jgi:hypothetical protein